MKTSSSSSASLLLRKSFGMKASELRQNKEEELQRLIEEKRELLRTLRFDLISGKVKNVKEIRAIKKDVARMITILNQNKKIKK